MSYKIILALPLLLLIVACTGTESENIRTSGIYAKYVVESDGYQIDVMASYRVGQNSNTYLELTGGDLAFVENGSMRRYLVRDWELFGEIEYVSQYFGDAGGTQYTITLERPLENEYLVSRATLPLDFDITPLANQYSANELVEVNWAPADNQASMRISLLGSCIYARTFSVSTGATHLNLLPGNYLKDTIGPGSCKVYGTIERSRRFPVDSGFGAGGRFEANQIRKFSFTLTY